MRGATSTDFFVRTPANCFTARSGGEASVGARRLTFSVDVRINRQNYTRSLAIHVPDASAIEVGAIVKLLAPKFAQFADLKIGDRNLIIAVSPDVPLGSGVNIYNGDVVDVTEQAPWLSEGRVINCRDFVLSTFVFIFCDCDELNPELEAAIEAVRTLGFELIFLGKLYLNEMKRGETPAFFVSYDARNREQIARPIAARLSAIGEPVWFDDFNLRPGDNLRQTIEDGLRKCRQCVLLVTKELLSNEAWAKVEFDAIFSREVSEKRKIIVPVWVDVTRNEVDAFSMSLANKFAVLTSVSELSSPASSASRTQSQPPSRSRTE
jgi:hypothetical protein